MSRVQLAINVPNLEEALDFYSRLFATAPHKVRSGYANFEIDEPPLKLVLVEGDSAHSLNHLGVEVQSPAEVNVARKRLAAAGMATLEEDRVVCCHAQQNKVWVTAPDGVRWEIYAITDDLLEPRAAGEPDEECCRTPMAAG